MHPARLCGKKLTMQRFYAGFVNAPLFWTAILFGAGIILGAEFGQTKIYLILCVIFIASALLLQLIQFLRKSLNLKRWLFLCLLSSIVLLGAFYYQAWLISGDRSFLERIDPDTPVWIRAKTKGLSKSYERYSRVLCHLVWLDDGKGRKRVSARFWLNYYEERKLYPGDEFLALVRIHRIKGFRNPGVPDLAERFYHQGVYFNFSQVSHTPILKIYSRKGNPVERLDKYRERLKDEIERSGARSSYLLLALLIGDQSQIPEQVMSSFRVSGTAHILVISGIHLSLVAAFCFFALLIFFRVQPWVLKRINPYPVAGLLSIIPVSFYALISGLGIPVIRAYIMVLVLLFAFSFRKIRHLLNTLGLAGLFIFLLNPSALFDLSFQLSFISVAVLILHFPSFWKICGGEWFKKETYLLEQESHLLRSLPRLVPIKILEYIYGLFLASILIQLFLAPILAYYFSRINLIVPFANIFIVPICGFWTLPIGLVGLFLNFISPDIAGWFLNLAGDGAWLMEQIVSFSSALPYASVLVRPPGVWEAIGWYLILSGVFGALNIFSRKEKARAKGILAYAPDIALILFCIILGAGLQLNSYSKILKFRPGREQARITVLDVGLGQSILIDLPGRKRILLDGAGKLGAVNLGEAVVGRYMLNQGIRNLDVVMLSHPQEDHGAGLEYILREFSVQEFWLTEKSNQLSQALLEIATRRGIKIRMINSQTAPVMIGQAQFEFLNPDPEQIKTLSLNDSSIVLKMTYQGKTCLFPGEISAPVEKNLIAKYRDRLKCNILIAPHHGSNTSSSPEFLKAVSPEFILISSGSASGIQFPNQSALERMQKTGAQIFRTDQLGAITLNIQNRHLNVPVSQDKNKEGL